MNLGTLCNFCYLKTPTKSTCTQHQHINNMPIHPVRPGYVIVDDILSPIKQPVSKLQTATATVQKRIRRKRAARRIKANEKKKLLKQQNILYNNSSRLNLINHAVVAQSITSDSDSADDMIMSEPTADNKINIQHTNTTKSNTDISASDINTDTDTDIQPSKLSFHWLVPTTTILTNTTTAITNTTKSIFTSIMQPWIRSNELQSTVQKLQDEMNALKSQLAAQQSNTSTTTTTTTTVPTAPVINSIPTVPCMNAPTAPPMAPPSAPPMAPDMSMPPPPPPPISFTAPSSTRGQMLANIANAKLKKNDTTAVHGSKQATLADISASDLLSAATRLRKPTDVSTQRTTRSGSQPTIDLADIMNVKLRSTPARNTRQSIGADKDGPIVSLLDLQSIKLKKSTIDKSPGGTPRIAKRNVTVSNETENTPGSFLFQQLTKKFKADPRSQLYQAHNVVLDTPWTQAKPKSPSARRIMKSPIAENVKSPANTVKSPRQVLSNVTNTTATSADVSATNRRISSKSPGLVKASSRRTSANNKSPKLLA